MTSIEPFGSALVSKDLAFACIAALLSPASPARANIYLGGIDPVSR